jgi:hypothetical protein
LLAAYCRSEKKVLNEINHSSGVRFHVTEAAGAEGAKRVKQRIQTAQEKLLILVSQWRKQAARVSHVQVQLLGLAGSAESKAAAAPGACVSSIETSKQV